MSRQIPAAKGTTSAALQAIRRFMFGAEGLAGAALVEFAVIAPAMIVIFGGLTDAGLLVFRTMEVQHAAQAGAQYINVHGFTDNAASVSAAVTNATTFTAISATPAAAQFCGCPSSSGITTLNPCTATCATGTPGTYVTVSAKATYSDIFFGVSHTLTAAATVRIQ